ncbi:hypothetical protein [Janthinobacterium sp.]|uniref:hypothetical protein n=1 Tax=Janthinobacterium sp. TaxID=1871054 RepID=UPI00293D949B|nr:hypothetical protein [Janthinobacterium sp.]
MTQFSDLFPSRHGQTGMTLVEVGEVIRRTGYAMGLEVIAEYPVAVDGKRGKIDWVWRNASGKVVRAFEVEGTDAPPVSITNDAAKFNALRALQARPAVACTVVAYSVRFKAHAGWESLSDETVRIKQKLPKSVRLVKDSELVAYLAP